MLVQLRIVYGFGDPISVIIGFSRSFPDMSTSLIKRLVVVVRIGRDLDSNDFANPSAMGFAS